MKYFDTHCDTIEKIYNFGGNLFENSYHVDLKRLSKYENFAQIFAAFVDKENLPHNGTVVGADDSVRPQANNSCTHRRTESSAPTQRFLNLIECYHSQITEFSEHITHCNTAADVSQSFENGKIAAMLAIEGGEALGGDLDNLQKFYNLGVRILTLTWNYDNELGCGALGGDSGLTDFGFAVVREMNQLGMIIDVSHLNEAGFWDVINTSRAPVIASHSNAQAVCPHVRNLSDKQISALIDMRGYIGLNLYSDFLTAGGQSRPPLQNETNADINGIQLHIEHFEKLGAGGILGLGCDFDGVDKLPHGICGVQDISKIPLSEDIAFNNFYNFLAKNIDTRNNLKGVI